MAPPESPREARARAALALKAETDAALAPKLYIHESSDRPVAKLPKELGSIEVYADTPEFENWTHLVAVRDWLRAYSDDLHSLRITAQEAVERLDAFLTDAGIPSHHRLSIGDQLRYLRAGLSGEPGVALGTAMNALRMRVAEAERVAQSVLLPAPPGPLTVAPAEGTGRHYGWSRSTNH